MNHLTEDSLFISQTLLHKFYCKFHEFYKKFEMSRSNMLKCFFLSYVWPCRPQESTSFKDSQSEPHGVTEYTAEFYWKTVCKPKCINITDSGQRRNNPHPSQVCFADCTTTEALCLFDSVKKLE